MTRDRETARRIAQEVQLLGGSVEEEVSFGPMNLRLPVGEVRARVDAAIRSFALEEYQIGRYRKIRMSARYARLQNFFMRCRLLRRWGRPCAGWRAKSESAPS